MRIGPGGRIGGVGPVGGAVEPRAAEPEPPALAPIEPGSWPAPPAAVRGSSEATARISARGPVERWEVEPGDTIDGIFAAVGPALGLTLEAFLYRVRVQHPGIDVSELRPGLSLSFAEAKPLAPTGAELVRSPIVRRAIEAAWRDSAPHDPERRHEEGGWIYLNVRTHEVFVHRAIAGLQTAIDLSAPPAYVDSVIVGTFHTHPNPSSEGWDAGPSASDRSMDESRGVPGIVRSDQGYHPYAWERRLDLGGSALYPGTPERPL